MHPLLVFDDDATLWSSDPYGRVVVTANACPGYLLHLLNAGRVRGLV